MKRRNTDFIQRFCLLNSQENTDEIVWTCSSSSDSENDADINSILKRNYYRTRNRKACNKLLTSNTSNLNVLIPDASQENRGNNNTSPILKPRLSKNILNFERNSSLPVNTETPKSPILLQRKNTPQTSPILVTKFKDNKSPKVCKNLFSTNLTNQKLKRNIMKQCISPTQYKRSGEPHNFVKHEPDDNSVNSEASKQKLVERTKSYFQTSLSTDSLSQHSISEYSTPKNSSKTSDEIEIIDFTQGLPIQIKQGSPNTHIVEKSKKVKYKKDGLAYRLDILLKKQNTTISLWEHEQYLANNSNFIMPQGAYAAFRITKVNFKFGCLLLLAVSDKDELFTILISNLHMKQKIASDMILKVYNPYNVLDFNDKCKLIVNVSKYVCESFDY